MATKINSYTEDCARKNTSPSTQQMDSSLRAVKTYGNVESLTRCKKDSWEVIDSNAEGCNQEGTSAYSEQTLV